MHKFTSISLTFNNASKFLIFIALSAFSMLSLAAHTQQIADPHACPGTIAGSEFSCVSNDIKIASVELTGNPPASCTPGSTVTIDINVNLLLNATERYDPIVWIGKEGNNPATVNPAACYASSLPDHPASPFVGDFEPKDPDSCFDVQSSGGEIVVQEMGQVTVDCVDTSGDGFLDFSTMVSWIQREGQLNCGVGPGEMLAPDGKPKCDVELINIDTIPVIPSGLDLDKTITSITGGTGGKYDSVGDVINYEYVLTNTGGANLLPPYAVDDNNVDNPVDCPNIPNPLPPAGTVTCTGQHTVTANDIAAGQVLNTATATAENIQMGIVTSNPDTEIAEGVQVQDLLIEKSVTSGNPFTNVGDQISYEYILTNNGNVPLNAPYSVNDDKVPVVDCPDVPASIGPGESVTCTATYTVDQADVDACQVTNDATGTAGGISSSNDDSETVPCRPVQPIVPTAPAKPIPALGGLGLLLLSGLLGLIGIRFRKHMN